MRSKTTKSSALLGMAALTTFVVLASHSCVSENLNISARGTATVQQPIRANVVSLLVDEEGLEEKRCSVNQRQCKRCGKGLTGDKRCELCEVGFFLSRNACIPMNKCNVLGDTVLGDTQRNDVARTRSPGCEAVSFYDNGHCVLHDHTALKTMGYKQGVQSARLDCKPIEDPRGDGCRASYCEKCGEGDRECLQCRGNFTRTDKGKCRYENKEEADWPDIRPPTFGSESEIIKNEVARIVSLMTIEEKIGQMTMARQKWIKPSEMKSNAVGSYLLGGDDDIGDNSAQAWARLSDRYWNATTEVGDAIIHPLFGIDAIHGHSHLSTSTLFPHNIGLGCTNDPKLIRKIGKITAKELVATGVDWTFAPTHAVAQNWRWGRTYESFSQIPANVERLAKEFVIGLQGAVNETFLGVENVLGCAKHFGGDGGTEGGIDQGNFRGTLQELKDTHLSPYFGSIEAGVQTIMASFNSWNGVKTHGNEFLLRDVLKRRLGFTGLVVGDWNGHAQVDGCSPVQCDQAVEAGVDIMMLSKRDWKGYLQNTTSSAKKGSITAEKIDDSVTRILTVKALYGAMTTPALRAAGIKERASPSQRPGAGQSSVLEAAEHRETAREAVRKSLVMLKNGAKGATGKPVPLSTTGKYLVTGRCADDIGLQNGGWTRDWQGSPNYPNRFFGKGESIYKGIRGGMDGGGSATLYQMVDGEFPDLSSYDALIFCTGEDPYAEYFGDRHWPASMDFGQFRVGAADAGFLEEVRTKYPSLTIVTLLSSGRPLYVNKEINLSDAFIAVWLPGTQGGGVADVLFGKNDLVGKLSFQWALDPCVTMEYNGAHGNDPPFTNLMLPIGYGLTYDDESLMPTLNVDHLPQCDQERR
ncbi:unnamed protein product [Vitrella brassicaformis CCMP3155]|uniref:Glycoside hydrolase family 3 N-terminal domain-containing protein n=2 Tax=Vitrella brassicaformis TaxID=1169539 RepID=A0A0G4GD67_VITBC|nr:unnamed protein product [Vitrella brassicaformis CCMP3155]|eukprot:CEM27137.1 unnamed protein product [Vitrella brassicaformis CCMP3155]